MTTGCTIKTSNLDQKEKCANYRKTMENMHNYANNEAPRPRGAGYQFSITTVIGDCYGVLYTH
ncbi:MAG: hypothetical protein CO030_04060, partial [Candidatus Magasanikbacteria bacterium CG_4_9_14_0_2_um_filter_42_11]